MLSREPSSLARSTSARAALSLSQSLMAFSPPPRATALPTQSCKTLPASSSPRASHKPSLAMTRAWPQSTSQVQTSGTQLTPELFRWWSPSDRETLSWPPTRPWRTTPPSSATRFASAGSLARWSVETRRAVPSQTRTARESPTLATWSVSPAPCWRRTRATVAVQPLFQAPSIASWPSIFWKAAASAERTSLMGDSPRSSARTTSCSFAST
mmetsp:Transcript_36946/g.114994  ORF Transcript_36946/g.114994 Transcript_36946/m.114994 type:complete len:212 (-) Transcript_36946:402-1037(-)